MKFITKSKLPLLIILIIGLELLIYFWALLTTQSDVVIDKCARNSGRASAVINLIILSMVGYYGLIKIYKNELLADKLKILLTLFAINHYIHFYFVIQRFIHHSKNFNIIQNKHGLFIIICILLLPILLWLYKKLNWIIYIIIISHLFNVSYFIMETLYEKITPAKPAYHNQFGIAITLMALAFIVLRITIEIKNLLIAEKQISSSLK